MFALNAAVAAAASAFAIVAIRSEEGIANGTGGEGGLTVGLAIMIASGACWLYSSRSRVERLRPGSTRDGASSRARLLAIGIVCVGSTGVAMLAVSTGFGRGSDTASIEETDPAGRLAELGGNRSEIWEQALEGFADHPIAGEGPGSFVYRWASEGSGPELVDDAHSAWLESLSELGLVGFSLFVLTWIGLILVALRGVKIAGNGWAVGPAAVLGVIAVSTAIDWTWEVAAVAVLGLVCAGLLGAAASVPMKTSKQGGRSSSRISSKLRVGAALAAFLAGAIQIPGAVAVEQVRESSRQLELGDPEGALDAARTALDAAPWSATAMNALAVAQLEAGRSDEAISEAESAVDAEPEEVRHRILLAMANGAAGELEAAAEALRDAVELSPRSSLLLQPEVAELATRIQAAGIDLYAPEG